MPMSRAKPRNLIYLFSFFLRLTHHSNLTMLIDGNVQQLAYSPFDPMSDFINFDLFNSSSSSSSSSPPPTLLTPPQSSLSLPNYQHPLTFTPDAADSSMFNFNLDDDFSKLESLISQPVSSDNIAPYDFMSAFSSSDSSQSPLASPIATLAIDPQLVGTPSTTKEFSDFDDDGDDEEDDDDNEAPMTTKASNNSAPVLPVKAAGHGKARRGTVQNGGVVKKSGASVNARDKENAVGTKEGASVTFEDGKPPDYQKLSSKEKRQLRNKISARNFRVRRKGGSHKDTLCLFLFF
jgi:hypothetical protein